MAGNGDHKLVEQLASDDLKTNDGLLSEALANQPNLAGDIFSLAVLYVAATLHWEVKIGGALTHTYPAIAELKSRVMANPNARFAFAGENFDTERTN